MPRATQSYHRYLPAIEGGRRWGLHVTGAGFERVKPGSPYPSGGHPASHDFAWSKGRILREYAIVYISSGAGQFESTATGEQAVVAGTAMVLFPGVWHRYRPLKQTGWEESWVCFAGEYAEDLQQRGCLRPEEPLLKVGPDELVIRGFTTLLDRIRSEALGFDQLRAASVWEILAAVLSAVQRREMGSRLHDPVRRAKLILEEHREGFPVIAEVAAAVGLSPSHLQHLFKEQTGQSPYQYHLQLKIQRAGEMLRGSDLPVKQISQILQFRSVYHFSTLFKKKTGLSPSGWRAGGQGGESLRASDEAAPPPRARGAVEPRIRTSRPEGA